MDKPRLFLVEDEVIIAADIAIRLRLLGYEVVGTATSGVEALALIDQIRPDLVLMDIRLQDVMDGITAAQEIRERFHLPVVFLTAYSESAIVARAKLAEPFGYILKPFVDREIAIVLELAYYKHQAEVKIQQLNAQLEQRVIERTAQLEAANKELEAFSYSVSHDLRAPLRAVSGYTHILLNDYAPRLDAEGQRICTVISQGAHDMGNLIDNLLAFARVGRAAMQLSSIEMEPLARSIFFDLTTPADCERIDFRVGPLPNAMADPLLLRQLWVNLLSNAVKFSSKKPRAVIEVTAAPGVGKGEVVYAVRDNGAGFDMQYVDKLFGVFQRLHSNKEFEGTGVGLAIVARIIERHGGRIWAEGRVDAGATIFFTLNPGDKP